MQHKFIRGKILHFLNNSNDELDYEYFADGLLEIANGHIARIDHWHHFQDQLSDLSQVKHYTDGLIMPGFIDAHMHLANLDALATPADELFSWLNNYIFPAEKRLSDPDYATKISEFFIQQMLHNGTTSAMVFNTIYSHAVDALFNAAEKRNMRLITGKTVGDRNLPDYLLELPEAAYIESKHLIQKWHKKPKTRLLYAITPRFVPTTTDALFEQLSQLKIEFPDLHVHTHISETVKDVEWTKTLTGLSSYLSTYEKYGLVTKGTLLAHGIYLTEDEMQRIAKANAGVAFCPTSNLFLGSGLFNLQKANACHMQVGLGSDLGAGTSFSLLQTLNEGYKTLRLQEQVLPALEGFYLSTLGSAKALGIDNYVGNLECGKEADFIVLDLLGATPLIKRRMSMATTLEEKLLILMMLGDERSICATYVAGKMQYNREVGIN
jgi:guanine deaminase